jgi:hypothetical protein
VNSPSNPGRSGAAAFRTTTFVGPRIGNYTNLSFFGTALSQLWVG